MLRYPQVELGFMNHDHAEFIGLRDALLAALAGHAAPAEVDAMLDRLLSHTRDRFAEEERLMQEVRFPPYPMHKGEHDRVLAEMESQIARWKEARDAQKLGDWLEVGLVDWFVSHVSTMDFVTARYIKSAQEQQ